MKRTFGAHSLAFHGILHDTDAAQLQLAAQTAARAGCTLFELACDPIINMSPALIASSLRQGGIYQASYCRFFPPDGSRGDPLGHEDDRKTALQTFRSDLAHIAILRRHEIMVDFITGPSCFVLGREYGHERVKMRHRIAEYLKRVADLAADADITVCVEYLRPGEDQDVIGSMHEMCHIVDLVEHPSIRIHGDIFHMLERQEDPAAAIRMAGSRLKYLHAHGSKRIEPGADRDGHKDIVDWLSVSKALDAIGYSGPIVPEPFGDAIRQAVPALGEGLPPAIDAGRYYLQSKITFDWWGIL